MIKDKKIKISKNDFKIFRYYALIHDYSGLSTIIGVSFISIFGLIDYVTHATSRSMLIAAICLFMLGSYVKNLFFDLPRSAREEYSKRSFSNHKYTLSISKDSLTVERETTSPSVIEFTTLYSAYETRFQFCFFLSKNNYMILPKRLLSAEEISELRATIKALPKANRKNPFSIGFKSTLKNTLMLAFITICAVIMIISYKIL